MNLAQRAIKVGSDLKHWSWEFNLHMQKGSIMMIKEIPLGDLNENKLVHGNSMYSTLLSNLDKANIGDSWMTLILGAMCRNYDVYFQLLLKF